MIFTSELLPFSSSMAQIPLIFEAGRQIGNAYIAGSLVLETLITDLSLTGIWSYFLPTAIVLLSWLPLLGFFLSGFHAKMHARFPFLWWALFVVAFLGTSQALLLFHPVFSPVLTKINILFCGIIGVLLIASLWHEGRLIRNTLFFTWAFPGFMWTQRVIPLLYNAFFLSILLPPRVSAILLLTLTKIALARAITFFAWKNICWFVLKKRTSIPYVRTLLLPPQKMQLRFGLSLVAWLAALTMPLGRVFDDPLISFFRLSPESRQILFLIAGGMTLTIVSDLLLRYGIKGLKQAHNAHVAIPSKHLPRLQTLLRLLQTVSKVIIWLPLSLVCLGRLGYDTTPFITGFGVLSLGFSFGTQALIKDFVTGFFLLLENTFAVGDFVEIDGRHGQVEDIGLRAAQLRTIDGLLVTIPFGSIKVIVNKSARFACVFFSIFVPAGVDTQMVSDRAQRAFDRFRASPAWRNIVLTGIELRGLDILYKDEYAFQIRFRTVGGSQAGAKRAFLGYLKTAFEADPAIPCATEPAWSLPALLKA